MYEIWNGRLWATMPTYAQQWYGLKDMVDELLWVFLPLGAMLAALWYALCRKKKGKSKGWLSFFLVFLFPLLLLFGFFVWKDFREIIVTPYPYEEPSNYCNSRWACEEVAVEFCMDQHGWFFCAVEGEDETMVLLMSDWRATPRCLGRNHTAEFSIYKTGAATPQEAVGILETGWPGEQVLKSRFLGFNEDEMVFRLRRKDLPLWGFTKPVELHFIREELTEPLDFNGPDCELCN